MLRILSSSVRFALQRLAEETLNRGYFIPMIGFNTVETLELNLLSRTDTAGSPEERSRHLTPRTASATRV